MSEWQTIDTAPKDGTPIDLWVMIVGPVAKDTGDRITYTKGRITDCFWDDVTSDWAKMDGTGVVTNWRKRIPADFALIETYWRHVPEPPEAP